MIQNPFYAFRKFLAGGSLRLSAAWLQAVNNFCGSLEVEPSGNGEARIEREADGRARLLIPMLPSRVHEALTFIDPDTLGGGVPDGDAVNVFLKWNNTDKVWEAVPGTPHTDEHAS